MDAIGKRRWAVRGSTLLIMELANEATSGPGRRARDETVHLEVTELVSELRDMLGDKLVAYIGQVPDTRLVRAWAEGDRVPRTEVVQRLQIAHQAAGLLSAREGKATVQSWFQGMNPRLTDRAPAHVLRDEPILVVGTQIISAAHASLADR